MNGLKERVNEVTKVLNMGDLNKKETLIVTVDMINGFIREGVLASNRVESIIPEVLRINKDLTNAQRLFFVDEHEANCKEFDSFPPHCIKGTSECSIISELKDYADNAVIVSKNSTNGYMTQGFIEYFDENKEKLENIVVIGCCTDLCVKNFAISLLTAINQLNLNINVLVPTNAVETYDLFEHDGDLINIMALYDMQLNGIGLCKFN